MTSRSASSRTRFWARGRAFRTLEAVRYRGPTAYSLRGTNELLARQGAETWTVGPFSPLWPLGDIGRAASLLGDGEVRPARRDRCPVLGIWPLDAKMFLAIAAAHSCRSANAVIPLPRIDLEAGWRAVLSFTEMLGFTPEGSSVHLRNPAACISTGTLARRPGREPFLAIGRTRGSGKRGRETREASGEFRRRAALDHFARCISNPAFFSAAPKTLAPM